MKNKKGEQSVSSILMLLFQIMMFGVISVIMVTGAYFFFAVGNDYVVLNLYNASTTFNTTAEIHTAFEDTVSYYQGIDLGFIDNMWFYAYLILVIVSFGAAYRVKTNYFTFFSLITYGLMLLLFVAGLFGTIMQFLYNDILQRLFLNLAISTPLLAYYVANYGIIFLVHAGLLFLTTMIDFDFAALRGRKKKEVASLDEIV